MTRVYALNNPVSRCIGCLIHNTRRVLGVRVTTSTTPAQKEHSSPSKDSLLRIPTLPFLRLCRPHPGKSQRPPSQRTASPSIVQCRLRSACTTSLSSEHTACAGIDVQEPDAVLRLALAEFASYNEYETSAFARATSSGGKQPLMRLLIPSNKTRRKRCAETYMRKSCCPRRGPFVVRFGELCGRRGSPAGVFGGS